MSIKTGGNEAAANARAVKQSDFNGDRQVDHEDVDYFLKLMAGEEGKSGGDGAGNIRDLLRLQKNGGEVTAGDILEFRKQGGEVDARDLLKFQERGCGMTAADLLQFKQHGGDLTGEEVVRFQEGGLELTAEDVAKLKESGVEITAEDMAALEKGGVPHTPRFPPGTTVQEVLDMAKTGVEISPLDLVELRDADGNPYKFNFLEAVTLGKHGLSPEGTMTLKGAIQLLEENGGATKAVEFPVSDLERYVEAGGYLSGDDLVEYTGRGFGKPASEQLVHLAEMGVVIWRDDLQTMVEKTGINLSPEQYVKINPKS